MIIGGIDIDQDELEEALVVAMTKAPEVVDNALRELSLMSIGLRKPGDPVVPLDAVSREAAARIKAALDNALGPVE